MTKPTTTNTGDSRVISDSSPEFTVTITPSLMADTIKYVGLLCMEQDLSPTIISAAVMGVSATFIKLGADRAAVHYAADRAVADLVVGGAGHA